MSDVVFDLTLDRYERDNLVTLLHLVYQCKFPGNNGDWVGQILWKLSKNGYDPAIHKPNLTPEQQIEALKYWSKP